MKNKQFKFLKRIVETPSPTGCEVPVAELVRDRLSEVADEVRTDTMGSVHAAYYGAMHHGEADGAEAQESEPAEAHTLMLAAHMDEVGLMVTYISDDGFLSVSAVGGVDAAILPGMRVDVHARGGALRGVVGRKPIHLIEPDDRKSVTPLDKLVIDLGMPAKKVKKKVRIGDTVTYGVGFETFGSDMAVSRGFDDKVGVFITCRVMENLAEDPDYMGNFVGAITVQEEIGTRGAMTSAHSIYPDVALAFDVTHATDYPGIDKTKYGDIKCGGGPVIARGPNINPTVFARLVKAARDEGIDFQLEAEPSVTGTDARSIQVTRSGIPTGLVSIPLRYMHTPTEVIDLSDVEGAIRLITRFAKDLDEVQNFVPGYYEGGDYLDDAHDDGEVEAVEGEEAAGKTVEEASPAEEPAPAHPLQPQDAPFGRQQGRMAQAAMGQRGAFQQGAPGQQHQQPIQQQPVQQPQPQHHAPQAWVPDPRQMVAVPVVQLDPDDELD